MSLNTDTPNSIPLLLLNRHAQVAGATGTGKTVTLQVLTEQATRGFRPGLETLGNPTEFYTLEDSGLGTPLRAAVTSFCPILLSNVLELNGTQESVLSLVFHYADTAGLALLDLSDLRAVLNFLTSDDGKADLEGIGGASKTTGGVILREITELSAQGGDVFFG